jgi:hypothetical protein
MQLRHNQMHLNLKFSLPLFVLTFFCALTTYAQDESQMGPEVQESNHHSDLNLNEEKTLLMDADMKSNKVQTIGREGNNSTIGSKIKIENQNKPSASEKTEEDPLSFNFLYFIIQKFKISDIVDD